MTPSSPNSSADYYSQWSPAWFQRLPKQVVRGALLLLGAGFTLGGLYLPWWHFNWTIGDVLPPDQRQLTIPAVTWGLGDVRTQLLLAVVVVAVVAGLVALILPQRGFRWLVIEAALAAGLDLAFAVLVESFSTYSPAVTTVNEGGFYLYIFGCMLAIGSVLTVLAE